MKGIGEGVTEMVTVRERRSGGEECARRRSRGRGIQGEKRASTRPEAGMSPFCLRNITAKKGSVARAL